MSVDLSPEQRGFPETTFEAPEMKVYPLGFTPSVKQHLRESGVIPTQGETSDFGNVGLLTEEEIAVVLAKVSRNPGGFLEIAKTVDEEGASQFHQKWVVSIEGYGHASVAEHAMLHMAVENVSSLAGDEVTNNRLASYTEFSARFKGRQNVGRYTPESVAAHPDLLRMWNTVHERLFSLNDRLMELGLSYIRSEDGRKKQPERRADGAKGVKTVSDQFKNLMPASRLTSIGVTTNAREAEHIVRKMLSSPYPEVQRLGARFKQECLNVAPTLVKYANRNDYLVLTREAIEFLARNRREDTGYPEITEKGQLVRLVGHDPDAEDKFIAAALYAKSPGQTLEQLLLQVKGLDESRKRQIFEHVLGNLGKHDAPIRMLEFAGDYQIEVSGMTYGDWREWKRHRIETYDTKDLSVTYGFMNPPLAEEMDESQDFQYRGSVDAVKAVMDDVGELYLAVKKIDPLAAHYCVTRLHYRPAIVKMNPREAFHLISLRTGPTAHPFIRRLAWAFYDEIKKVHPLFAEHLGRRLYSQDRPSRDFNWTY
ncbi:hypothetical protein A2985_00465 [Candidatus Woesebacteria bacterium RIFCSPLOWO2_01_FULL_43_11]|uniref:Thymidylate synthase complementing protein ThyX n=1 Tax=Candidatus Woesebacteria bacterium RBG_16_42_24 TaxID=1802485 RepID=A0A1F7XJS3_9BACT|nr:MAG: hypothetical protein A2V97_01535 [Candidatus Woesebacteria bacterium RBG_16_42_24]OGM67623.1 MAG: hypothetical protein A2985_00465 [Candidatus Woesebacteria bacterium RIFCSPLOWO2_01_FULL_43_11]